MTKDGVFYMKELGRSTIHLEKLKVKSLFHSTYESDFQVNPKIGVLFFFFLSYKHMEDHISKYSYSPTVQEVFLSKTGNHKPLRKKKNNKN